MRSPVFLADQLFYYITSRSFCQALFSSFFQNLFEMFATRLADSLFIISLFFSLVKCFFQISLKFFHLTFFQKEKIIYKFLLCQTQLPLQASCAAPAVLPFRSSCLVRQLYYYSTFFRLCQLKVWIMFTRFFSIFGQALYTHIYYNKLDHRQTAKKTTALTGCGLSHHVLGVVISALSRSKSFILAPLTFLLLSLLISSSSSRICC